MIRASAMVFAAMLALGWSAPAKADTCEGDLPTRGTSFAGIVRYIGDGDSLCVGPQVRPDRWIEVRLGDFYAPELEDAGGEDAKHRLRRLVMNRRLVCRAGRRSYDRVIGYCTLGGQPVGDLLRASGGIEGGRGWR